MTLPMNEVGTHPLAYESLWVLAHRFMAVNHLRPHEFAAKFSRDRGSQAPLIRSRLGYCRLDLHKLAPYIGHTEQSVVQTVPDHWEFHLRSPRQGLFKYCPACLEEGYHSVFHEVSWLHRCPIHERDLKWNCGQCNRHLGHTTIRRLGTLPGHFPCDHPWTSTDIRKPEVYRSSDFANVAAWTRRLRARHGGEHWYAVALDSSACLYADNGDFKELTDLVSCLGAFSPELRSGIRNARFLTMLVERERLRDLRRDWFSVSLSYAANFQRLECGANLEMYDIRDHFHYTVRHVGQMGEEGLLNAVHEKLIVMSLADRRRQVVRPDSTILNLVASTFLKKHIFSMFWRDYEYDTALPEAILTSAMRLTAQPLGLLRKTATNLDIFWSPLRWGQYAAERLRALKDGYASGLARARAQARHRMST